eukprot:TRINITY_DN41141_c0_g1_i1.p1 TRINITY_DN41141_c0_g1~~TRINITY_DN41141_c0_g1_i1.p1  ORF type:complete len:313 (-),score=52.81 TRINITY_DN41141_c0_g1_i1:59-997(-)
MDEFNFEFDDIPDGEEIGDGDLGAAFVGLLHTVIFFYLCKKGIEYFCCKRKDSDAKPGEPLEVSAALLQPKKRLMTSYILLFTGFSVFPAHHFYLERTIHGMLATFTLNFGGLGFLLDLFLMPFYVRGFNRERCSELAPYDKSRRAIFCWTPMVIFGIFGFLLSLAVYTPQVLQLMGVIDIDRATAQTEVNPYELLGLARGATMSEAKLAYRTASLKWHPDRNPGCGDECNSKMAEITKAFELIKKKRAPPPPDRSWEGTLKQKWADTLADWQVVVEEMGKWAERDDREEAAAEKARAERVKAKQQKSRTEF